MQRGLSNPPVFKKQQTNLFNANESVSNVCEKNESELFDFEIFLKDIQNKILVEVLQKSLI